MLTSCLKEPLSNEYAPLGENDIAFVLDGSSTKSMGSASMKETGVTIPMGADNQGNKYYFQETIEELNPSLATKGAPAYTVNVGKVFTDMGVYAAGNFGDTVFELKTETPYYDNPNGGKGWRYSHEFSGNPWPDNDTAVDFYLRMPASQSGVTGLSYDNDNKTTSFSFTSPYTAAAQQDILFSRTSISKTQHDGYLPKGAPVMMSHALTGVKFRVGSDNTGSTKTVISKVVFSGLYDAADCVVDFSTSTPTVDWDNHSVELGTFTATFDIPTYDPTQGARNSDGTVDFTHPTPTDPEAEGYVAPGDDGYVADYTGTSWTTAAADKNLNNGDGSLTFWLIPQTIEEDVTLEVYFRVETPDSPAGTEIKHTVNFGELFEGVVWLPGQLRTYTLNPHDVDVEIMDTMSGMKKDGLHVANTGNVEEYVRMLIVGNWYGWLPSQDPTKDEPSLLVGYKTDGSGGESDNEMVPYWDYRDRSKTDGSYFDSTFQYGVPANGNKWIRGTGAYYYPYKIGAGAALNPGTDALFKSYEYTGTVPDIYIPSATSNVRDKAIGVHLVMEIVVQAIPTVRADGTEYDSIWQAWSETTGTTIVQRND